jgi:hypothetical protein
MLLIERHALALDHQGFVFDVFVIVLIVKACRHALAWLHQWQVQIRISTRTRTGSSTWSRSACTRSWGCSTTLFRPLYQSRHQQSQAPESRSRFKKLST